MFSCDSERNGAKLGAFQELRGCAQWSGLSTSLDMDPEHESTRSIQRGFRQKLLRYPQLEEMGS